MPLSRRNFLTLTAIAGSLPVAGAGQPVSFPCEGKGSAPGFDLMIFATNWGFSGSWDAFASRIADTGYAGAEVWYPSDSAQRDALLEAFARFKLKLGFLVGGSSAEFGKHLETFTANLEKAAAEKPVYVNCHSGRDHFSFEQNKRFIDTTLEVSRSTGVPVYHETHRARILYSAPVARQFIERLPGLRLTLDISHWCNVHESLLEDQRETVEMALTRTDHIHARIGHPEGPQVNDPRAPEWAKAVEAHFGWWDKVVSRKKKEGKPITFLTEFGPADYMPALPYTRQPVADQWEINRYMLETLRSRYS